MNVIHVQKVTIVPILAKQNLLAPVSLATIVGEIKPAETQINAPLARTVQQVPRVQYHVILENTVRYQGFQVQSWTAMQGSIVR